MPVTNWNDAWSVGIESIDDQHRRLLRMISEFHDAMARGGGRDMAGPFLRALLEYTRVHFATEERYMDEIGFPGREVHRLEHVRLAAALDARRAAVEEGAATLGIELATYLADWLVGHIAHVDRRYGDFVRRRPS